MAFQSIEAWLRRIGLDRYMILLIATVVMATLLPAQGAFAVLLSHLTYWAVALLFFLYGAKLSAETIMSGLTNWRLQLGCLLSTYALFPVLALGLAPLVALYLPATFAVGLLYLGCLPSTVQSSIAFTSVSGGNVAGAVCAASASNLIGVVLAPLLFAVMLSSDSGIRIEASALWKICQQILLPFALGQLCRPLLGAWLNRHRLPTMIVDRGSILLIVYTAFSAGVVNGIWQIVGPGELAGLVLAITLLMAVAMVAIWGGGRLIGMGRADLLALFYCGSTKSLATGLPMAGILFQGQNLALIVLPLMLFHLMQLFVCAIISQRFAAG